MSETDLITSNKITEYMDALGIAAQLNDKEKKQFIEIAIAYQLNPFKREIYCIAYGEGQYRKLSIITGYETYLKRAERTGKMDGWQAEIEGTGEDMTAKVTIYRKDWKHPFIHVAHWSECKQMTYDKEKKIFRLNAMWDKMGKFMLKKVAIAQAFRLCFPDEMGGMPYTSDELPENMTHGADSFFKEPEIKTDYTLKLSDKPKGNVETALNALRDKVKNANDLAGYKRVLDKSEWTQEEYLQIEQAMSEKEASL